MSTYNVESTKTLTDGSGDAWFSDSSVFDSEGEPGGPSVMVEAPAAVAATKSRCILRSLSLPSLAVSPQARFAIECFTCNFDARVAWSFCDRVVLSASGFDNGEDLSSAKMFEKRCRAGEPSNWVCLCLNKRAGSWGRATAARELAPESLNRERERSERERVWDRE
jgi:hypothetical protein